MLATFPLYFTSTVIVVRSGNISAFDKSIVRIERIEWSMVYIKGRWHARPEPRRFSPT